MGKVKTIVTLVGVKQAKEGFVFLHAGPIKDCEKCERYKVCMENLRSGRVYRVVGVREKSFPCRIHEEGARVVDVMESDIDVAMDRRQAFIDAIMTFHPQECGDASCPDRGICQPIGLLEGDRCKVLEVGGQITCSLGRPLVRGKLRLAA